MLRASKIPMQDSIRDLRFRQQRNWKEADALSPREMNREAVTYHHCVRLGAVQGTQLHAPPDVLSRLLRCWPFSRVPGVSWCVLTKCPH
eukprot:1158790-Pelagomonas_calceolata.AAC.16